MKEGLFIIARGIGQVMFQNNALSGLLMLAGIACNSWILALLALAGNIVSTLTACLCKYSREDIRNGLYGFNGTLVGIAIGVFMEINISSMFLLLFGSALSTWISRLFNRQKTIPGFTAPFIITVWILLLGNLYLFPTLLLPAIPHVSEAVAHLPKAFCLNIGQVMFQGGNILAGLLFLIGILVNSRIQAIYTVWGAFLPLLVVLPLTTDFSAFNAGLLGYNGVLCSIALGNRTFKSIAWATLAILLSTGIQITGMYAGITTLTAPFVVAVWIMLCLQHLSSRK
ncbi:MAG: urea transporter [Butyricimonas virosa]|jgi:urea transporter|uniref:urea transporter n=1 Tax=Butyricimonas virosa TaxID=544645 RepID=UPI00242C1825|nr:urea transporter [Butyricimonas virosa]MDY5533429.1 urea transporter [Butyricimonas virosa]